MESNNNNNNNNNNNSADNNDNTNEAFKSNIEKNENKSNDNQITQLNDIKKKLSSSSAPSSLSNNSSSPLLNSRESSLRYENNKKKNKSSLSGFTASSIKRKLSGSSLSKSSTSNESGSSSKRSSFSSLKLNPFSSCRTPQPSEEYDDNRNDSYNNSNTNNHRFNNSSIKRNDDPLINLGKEEYNKKKDLEATLIKSINESLSKSKFILESKANHIRILRDYQLESEFDLIQSYFYSAVLLLGIYIFDQLFNSYFYYKIFINYINNVNDAVEINGLGDYEHLIGCCRFFLSVGFIIFVNIRFYSTSKKKIQFKYGKEND